MKIFGAPSAWLAITTLAVWMVVAIFPHWLDLLGLGTMGAWFLDTRAILSALDAVRQGLDPTIENPLDPLGRPHVYSRVWLWLAGTGLRGEHTLMVGLFGTTAFLATMFSTVRPMNGREFWVALAIIVSPPVLLALNRGNNDLAVFVCVGLGVLLWRVSRSWLALVGIIILLLLGVALKYYPIAALVALVLWRPPREAWLAFASGLVLSTCMIAWLWSDTTRANLVDPSGLHAFGAAVALKAMGIDRSSTRLVAAFLVLAGSALLAWRASRWQMFRGQLEAFGPSAAAGAAMLVLCFILGAHFAYRWIFALWLILPLWRSSRAGCWALVASTWLDGIYCLTLNLGWWKLPALGWERLYIVASQAIVWALMLWLGSILWLMIASSLRALKLKPADF